ncbi:MAG: NADH-quinone oxidoreductase subunit J [Gemmatimonadota bacterium]
MDVLFYIFAAIAIGGAFGVVLSKNPVASLMFMVVTLANLAAVFVLLEAHFLAAVQIVVYAGAIMVLFLFVIMLLNLGHDFQPDIRGGILAVVSFGVVGAMAGMLARQFRAAPVGDMAAAGGRAIDAAQMEYGVVGAFARPLFTDYVVPFEITGILLLVAIVGAIALAKRRVS